MTHPLTAEDVKAAWLKVFPESDVRAGVVLGGTFIQFYLQKKHEVANGIRENDPLSYTIWLDGDTAKEQDAPYLTIKPQEKYFAFSGVKLRKQNIKQADYPKLVKRFQKIKEFIKANESEWYLDLSDKIV